jgi:ribosomal protection tetracycline resistance protein
MPHSLHNAVEETVYETLRQGLYGWPVTDCTVTLTHSGYWPRQSHSHATFDPRMSSTASDFRNLTPLVLMSALKRAGTHMSEPIDRFHLEFPTDTLGTTLAALARLRAVPEPVSIRAEVCTIEGEIPAAQVHELQRQLASLTRGEGVLDSAFECYRPVRGSPPIRARSDLDPLDRKQYLLRVARRF